MDILQVNKFFWEHAGPERYMFEIASMLEGHGHNIGYFSMEHERNLPSPFAKHFVSTIDYRNHSTLYRAKTAFKTLGKTLYSFEAKRRMRALLNETSFDIAHLHIISHQLSPSILHALRRHKVPVVQTLHDYKRVCPASCLYIKQHNTICERCLGGNYLHCVRHRCLKASLAASTLACIAQYLHRATAIFEKHVDVFICPSTFLAEKMAQGGIPEKKLRVLQNFLDLRGYQPKFDVGDYFVFMGRLAEEKGITTLLDACARVPEIPVQIVGEGEHEEALKALAKEKGLTNLRFVGYQGGETLKEIVQNAAGVLIPSEWYENCPMVTYEAYALGKPVVASRIGGIPESIEDGVTGYLTEPGDAAGLAECMKRLATDPAACQAMGRAGRKRVEHICEGHYEGLMAIYEEARGAIIS